MKNFLTKKGFTLVEILVVLAIIAVLSSLAINGYLQYRKSALLDLSADNIIAQINELREKTIHGDFGSGRYDEIRAELEGSGDDSGNPAGGGSLCYGIFFEKSGENFEPRVFSVPFNGGKIWDNGLKSWSYEGCDDLTGADMNNLELDENVFVKNITNGAGMGFYDVVLKFMPPKGELESKFSKDEVLKIRLQYGLTDDLQFQRDIIFDLYNLNANVAQVEKQ